MKTMMINALLSSAVYPLLLGFILALILSKVLRPQNDRRDWIPGIAVFAGFLACFFTTASFVMPPHSVFDWMPYVALLALIGSLIAAKANTLVRCLAFLPAIALGVWIFLKPVAREWTSLHLALMFSAIALIWAALWFAHGPTRKEDTPARILLLVIFATTASIVSVMCESAKLAQVSGGLAAATGSLFLVWCFVRDLQVGAVVSAVFLGAIGCILLNGYFYVEVPLYAIALVLLSGLSHWLLRLPQITALSPVKRTILVVLLSLLPLASAIYCIQAFKPEEDPYGY